MNRFIKFFHEMFHPHCEHCIAEDEDKKVCPSCETLRIELERIRDNNQRLLEAILEKPKEEVKTEINEFKPLMPSTIPWRVRRQMLEEEDRKKFELMKKFSKPEDIKDKTTGPLTVEKLEEELGVARTEEQAH